MRTKKQDDIVRRSILRREENLLLPHLARLLNATSLGGSFIAIERVDRDGFLISVRASGDVKSIKRELEDLFGAVCSVERVVRSEGCCDECYDEYDADLFDVALITKNWPTEELAKLAPSPRKTT